MLETGSYLQSHSSFLVYFVLLAVPARPRTFRLLAFFHPQPAPLNDNFHLTHMFRQRAVNGAGEPRVTLRRRPQREGNMISLRT